VNTPAPQGSTGITTNIFPSMTLGCGAVAGNITSDNVGPLHLINVKRLAYVVRQPQEAFEMPLEYDAAAPVAGRAEAVDRQSVAAAVERYLAARSVGSPAGAAKAAASTPSVESAPACGCAPHASAGPSCSPKLPQRSEAPAKLAGPPPRPVDFVCEADVRAAIAEKRRITIGPGTIVTPSARDLAGAADVLAPVKS